MSRPRVHRHSLTSITRHQRELAPALERVHQVARHLGVIHHTPEQRAAIIRELEAQRNRGV